MTQIQTDPQNDLQKNGKVTKENEPAQLKQPTNPDPEEQKQKQKPWQKIPKPIQIIGAIALLAGVGYGVYRLFFYHPAPEGLFLSGRIEGYETDIAAKTGGKVANVAVREGDAVKPGQLLVRLDDADLQAQLQGAIARVRQAKERLARYQQQLPILAAQLQQASLTTDQSQQDSQGRVTQAANALDSNRANLVETLANLKLAQSQQKRYVALAAEGAVSVDVADQYNNAAATAQAKVEAARQTVRSAAGTLEQAQATSSNTPIKAAAALQVEKQIAQAQTDISVYVQAVRDAEATQTQTQANLNYLVIKSPIAGDIITRSIEPGEVVAAGAPLLTLVNQQKLYLRGFVEEGQIGQVKLGQRAQVYLDSFPNQPLEATISRIDPKASFTPENTYFKKDRVTQVFGVELTLNNNGQGKAKQGMPADGRIFLPESEPKREQKRSSTLMPGFLSFLPLFLHL